MNFTSFTGNSRKTRNVNLSGQKTTNPFAASWSSGAPSGASKTVANAQAERQQRQLERDRLKAALRLQRVWRGYGERRVVRELQRQQFDDISQNGLPDGDGRMSSFSTAMVLLLAFFQAARADDRKKLLLVSQYLLQSDFRLFKSGELRQSRLSKFSRALLGALQRNDVRIDANSESQILLRTLLEVVRMKPRSLEEILGGYYKALGEFCRCIGDECEGHVLELLGDAVVAPLLADPASGAFAEDGYREFALSFLTQEDLGYFERNTTAFAHHIDLPYLSTMVLKQVESVGLGAESSRLWLLSHFIALQRSRKDQSPSSIYIKALHAQLSRFSVLIRNAFAAPDQKEELTLTHLPPYVINELRSLVTRDEISSLLQKFSMDRAAMSAAEFEDAILLADYILTLIHCFPTESDDICLRLFRADIATPQGRLPALRYFWDAMRRTSIFAAISVDENSTMRVLRREPNSVKPTTSRDNSRWDREWQSILLFLEMYAFILPLTDDDDFFNPATDDQQASQLRRSGLSMQELKTLTRFLKHLGFNLYYHAAEIQQNGGSQTSLENLSDFLIPRASRRETGGSDRDTRSKKRTFNAMAGVDFETFRSAVITATQQLYQRDSRRRFLPEGHWLMTSKFDMDGFCSAVVLEEQRKHELQESGELDDEDDLDEDSYEIADSDDGHITSAGQRLSRNAQIEKFREQQKKTSREKLQAAIAPKLEILRNMPFVIPFETRVQIFRQFVLLDKNRRRGGHVDPDQWRMWVINQHGGPIHSMGAQVREPPHALTRHSAEIHRGKVFKDALDQFYPLEADLKEPIQITFVDEFGMAEAGIDGGGVTKEFLTSVTKETFTDEGNLFVANKNNAYYPNPCAVDQQKEVLKEAGVAEDSLTAKESIADLLRQYEFLGRIIGKCLYEGILIDVSFAGFFLLKWTAAGSNRASINDLHELDEELYQGMLRLKNYPGDVRDLDIDFTILDQVSRPGEPLRTVTRNLVEGGEKMLVTNENRLLYITYVARHRLAVQPRFQTWAFLRGLSLIIDPTWLSMFNQSELQRLVGGDSKDIDVEDLRANTAYTGIYQIGDDGEEHPTIKMFWEVMHEIRDSDRRDVLKFVTSTPRAPLLGFGQLSPTFTIRDGGSDEERLPSASTCVNLLKLPKYNSKETLKQKLLYAAKSHAGFDLS